MVEVGVIAFPTTMDRHFPQLIRIMTQMVETVLKFTRDPGGIIAVTMLISMGITMAQEEKLQLLLELFGRHLMEI